MSIRALSVLESRGFYKSWLSQNEWLIDGLPEMA